MDCLVMLQRSPAAGFFGRPTSTRTADRKRGTFLSPGHRLRFTCIAALMAISTTVHALAQSATKYERMSAECIDLNYKIVTQMANGQSAAAETLVSAAITSGPDRAGDTCAGIILNNMAALLSASGRMAEAERFAEQSINILEQIYLPNDLVLLRPLEILVSVRSGQGKIAAAREAYNRMTSIRTDRPEDHAVVHESAAILFRREGRLQEAETECLATIRAWEEAGEAETRNAGAVLLLLGMIDLAERRFDQARQALDRASDVFNRSRDTVPNDQIILLNLRGILYALQRAWKEAEHDLSAALSMADRQVVVDPVFLRSLLTGYAYVLRKNHYGREARRIEARAARLPSSSAESSVVDLSELLAKRKPAKK